MEEHPDTETFINTCRQLSPLDAEAAEHLKRCLRTKHFHKGEHLLDEGQVCRDLYLIESGLAKTYFSRADKAFIMQFFPKGALFTVLDSFVAQKASNYAIMALENTHITCISYTDLEALCHEHHSIESFYRKLVSRASVNMMKRISEMLEENATERYDHFVRENKALLQRLSLGDLACYLGITQTTLSRIRAK